jgi:hypothetical protein
MLYLPLTFVEYNCHNPSSLTGQNNGSIFWFFRRLLDVSCVSFLSLATPPFYGAAESPAGPNRRAKELRPILAELAGLSASR